MISSATNSGNLSYESQTTPLSASELKKMRRSEWLKLEGCNGISTNHQCINFLVMDDSFTLPDGVIKEISQNGLTYRLQVTGKIEAD